MSHPYEAEFNKLYNAKNGTDEMLGRIFKPEKFKDGKDFHSYLDWLHERWIAFCKVQS